MKNITTVLAIMLMSVSFANAQQPSITTGLAAKIHDGLIDCGPRSRVTAVGTITSTDGKT